MPTGRVYQLPDGTRYPSITTILSKQEKPEIDQWIARVGEQEAEQIKKRSAIRGQKLHKQAEYYLGGQLEELKKTFVTPMDSMNFNSIKKLLDQYVDQYYCFESSVYSKQLHAAGQLDCAAIFNGVPSIIDFKTARSDKNIDQLNGYFMQTSAYAYMFEQLTGIEVRQMVLLFAYEWGDNDKFIESRDKYLKKFTKLRLNIWEQFKI